MYNQQQNPSKTLTGCPRSAQGLAETACATTGGRQSEAVAIAEPCVPTGDSPRLEKRTYLDEQPQATVNARLFTYPDGHAEIGWSVKTTTKPPARGTTTASKENRKEHQERANRRAAATVRRKAMTMQADRLLTLTYRRNEDQLSRAWEDFQKFARLMRETFPGFKYIVVPEYQKRGAVHFHMAIKGFYPVNTVRKLWRHVIQDGNIDITTPRHGNHAWQPYKLASYLCKYITKDLRDDMHLAKLGAHRFRTSLGIHIQIITRSFAGKNAESRLLAWMTDEAGSIAYLWKKDEEIMCGWACSWG